MKMTAEQFNERLAHIVKCWVEFGYEVETWEEFLAAELKGMELQAELAAEAEQRLQYALNSLKTLKLIGGE
ncbi:TPA: hypothetical protein N5Y90_002463 [Vibrio cholerae]|uniref:Uncharacterized protein n=1 Tax=Vibrio cholerae TaxID=666 RepID=A0A395TFB6_VIBCL|nr:hypothetical protein [Vibrio cholerae]EJB4830562.1 hypothetical protein [Vibrio cholerae]EJB5295513.1 hypothetical protein [Vibrio cholerae]EJL6542619.1 hypothetical protein [Vibrio cholerae]ELJ8610546.1 hypothetical protein [Vibrio cholerae]ELJ8706341.1 hypothetical protein [Vibrio cholerae]